MNNAGGLMAITKREPAPDPAADRPSIRQSLAEGFRAVYGIKLLRILLGQSATLNVGFGMVSTIFTLYAVRVLHFSPDKLGLAIGSLAAGALCGSLLAGRVERLIGLPMTLTLAIIGVCASPLLLLIPRDAGVVVDKKEDKMGQRASNTATVSFNDVEIPADHLIGEENKGFKIAMMTLDRTRPGVAAMAVGIARAAFEFARDYSKERVQFGVPIAMHQAIQFMIADMATKIEAARLLTWKSAVLLDQGQRNTLVSSHAKRFAADTAMEVTVDAVQVYGGYGFIKEYPVEKLMRDAKIMQLYEGTSQIQRLVIAREVLMPRKIEEPAAATA